MIKKSLAAASLAILAVFAVVPAANAVSYVPSAPDSTVSANGTAGGTSTVAFGAGSFANGESVTFTLTGATSATLTVFKAAMNSSLTKAASATGGASVAVALPSNASGSYTLTGNGATASVSSVITVTAADGGLANTGKAPAATGKSLASTGYNVPMLIVWAAAGILLLGIALAVVRTTVRRHRVGA